jgi:hypothetical protein
MVKEIFTLSRDNTIWYGINIHTNGGLFLIGVFDISDPKNPKLQKYVEVHGFLSQLAAEYGDHQDLLEKAELWKNGIGIDSSGNPEQNGWLIRHIKLLRSRGFSPISLENANDDKLFNLLYKKPEMGEKPDQDIKLHMSDKFRTKIKQVITNL